MKRIVVCSDGTWNRPGITDRGKPVKSNVEIVYNCIADRDKDNISQVKFYETGVGSSTYSWKDKFFGGSTGAGLEQKVKDIYTFLVLNYQPGDHTKGEKPDSIYLFGFSRGAYTARSVAGFIRNCGILKPEYLHLVDKAYELYRDRNDYTSPDSDMMLGFKRNFCYEEVTRIKFLGVWDTVGSLGIPLHFFSKYNTNRYKFHDVKLSSTIENAYHAIAVDEKRKLFQPTLWEITKSGLENGQSVEQRWFCGAHCNIGGGYVDTGLSDLALKWLMEKSENAGLEMDWDKLKSMAHYQYNPSHAGELRNSRISFYRLWFPTYRKVSEKKRINEEGREVQTNEVIDESVRLRWEERKHNYQPYNLNEFGWKKK